MDHIRIHDNTVWLGDAQLTDTCGCCLVAEMGNARVLARLVGTEEGEAGNLRIILEGDCLAVDDLCSPVSRALMKVRRTWRNISAGVMHLNPIYELRRPGLPDFWVIPGVSYNGNERGTGKEPKGWQCQGKPWVFAYDRCTVPSCTIAEVGKTAMGLFVSDQDEQSLVSACSVLVESGGWIQRIIWPDVESPFVYSARDRYEPAYRPTITLEPGAKFSATLYVSIHPVVEQRTGWFGVMDDAWRVLGAEVRPWHSVDTCRQLAESFAANYLWCEDSRFQGFNIGLQYRDGNWVQRPGGPYEVGWCGQNAGLALGLLYAFHRTGQRDYWRKAEMTLDNWAENGRVDNGLIYTHMEDRLSGKWPVRVDTCNLGHAARRYLEAYRMSRQLNREKTAWKSLGLGVCDFFAANQLSDGKFGKIWDLTGRLVDGCGATGAHILMGLTVAHQLTGERKYQECAMRAYGAYAEDDLRSMQCFGGALDTNCVDKESAWPLLMAGLDLYEASGDEYFLKQAVKAAYYLQSWLFHYNIPFPVGTPLHAIGYQTRGGTTVSTQHHHIDPWGAIIAVDWLRLGHITGDERWRQIGRAAWQQSTIGVWDGTTSPDEKGRPAGSQDEGWYHTRWGRLGAGSKGGTSAWLVAWPAAFHMLAPASAVGHLLEVV